MTAGREGAAGSANGRAALTPVSFKKGRAHAPRLSAPYVPGRRHARFWTKAEEAVLRGRFPLGAAALCRQHLPHRSEAAIYIHARLLKLDSPAATGARQRIKPPADIDERIREGWAADQSRGFSIRLAERLGVPKWWLCRRAVSLGLGRMQRKEPPWTRAEDALLRKVPLHNPAHCARIFREHGYRRTPTAIAVRCKRLEISRRWNGALSATAAARILGADAKSLSTWCLAGDIKAGRRGTRRLPQQGGDAWTIEPAELRRFVLANLDRIDIRKVDKLAFVKLLVGEDLK